MARKNHSNPEDAREAILKAAEKMVVQVGPAGLRISAVAKEAKMAHPNIIHHFGSRDGLLVALAERVSNRATERITIAINQALIAPVPQKLAAMTHVLDQVYCGDEGRCAIWMHLSGAKIELKPNMERIVEASHQLRKSIGSNTNIENTSRLVMLVTLALIGEVVSGESFKEALGFDTQNNDTLSFREWLAQLLLSISDSELDRQFSPELAVIASSS